METLDKIKLSLRISHNKLDDDILSDISACCEELKMHGIAKVDESDPLIFNAIKLYCKACYTDDPDKAEAFRQRYNVLRDCLKAAEGYGWEADADD